MRYWSHFKLLIYLYSKLIPVDWKTGGQLVTSAASHIDILCHLGLVYQSSVKFEIAREYLQQGLSIARKNENKKAEVMTLFYLSRGHNSLENYKSAIKYLQDSLAVAIEIEEYEIEDEVLNTVGYINHECEKYNLAIAYFSKALKVACKNSSSEGEALAFTNLANTYIGLKKYDLAINYYNQYIAIVSQKQQIKCKNYLLADQGDFFANIQKYKRVITWAQEPLENYMNCADKQQERCQIKGLVTAYNGLEEYQNFFTVLSECIKLESDGDSRHKAYQVYELGKTFQNIREIEEAIENIPTSECLLDNIDNNAGDDRLDTLKVLIELAKTLLRCVIGFQLTMQYYLNQAEEICKELQLPLLIEIQKLQADLQQN